VAADGFVPQQRLLPLLEDTDLPPAELAGERVPAGVRSRFPIVAPGGWTPVEGRGETGAAGRPQPLARPAPGALTGRIIDRDTRAPLPCALVWPESDPGRWRLGVSYLVTAALAGFAPASTAVAVPKPGAAVPGLRLVLGRGRTAFGQVVDESGRPVAGARVELAAGTTGRAVASDAAASGKAPQQAQTGADGKFELRHLPAG